MLKFALLCDGTSDLCIEDIVNWLMYAHFPERTFRVVPARELIPAREGLAARLQKTVALYEPHAVLCHRDTEGVPLAVRTQEIVVASGQLLVPTIPVVPVRMLEAWLMFDEGALRSAADNQNGSMPIDLPPLAQVERTADPKEMLLEALRGASGLSTRRKKNFNEHRARSRITSFTEDFSPLRQLPAFRQFEQHFVDVVATL